MLNEYEAVNNHNNHGNNDDDDDDDDDDATPRDTSYSTARSSLYVDNDEGFRLVDNAVRGNLLPNINQPSDDSEPVRLTTRSRMGDSFAIAEEAEQEEASSSRPSSSASASFLPKIDSRFLAK